MTQRALAPIAFLLTISALSAALASPTSHPGNDPNFMVLPGGTDLRSVSVSGSKLSLSKGVGKTFTAEQQAKYLQLKKNTQTVPNYPMQWVLMDLDSHQVIAQSKTPNMKIFGASTSKMFIAGVLLDAQAGKLSKGQLQTMSDMLVVSSNKAWESLQLQIGGGNDTKGQERVQAFTQRMGYERTRAFKGTWGKLHGNELTASESAEYLYDMYQQKFPGSETVWKIMHTCRTGPKARTYLPTTLFVGGKTGTYPGPSVNPETGSSTNPDGSPYRVDIHNHAIVFNAGNKEYAMVILSNTGSDESVAVLAGGLYREYVGGRRL